MDYIVNMNLNGESDICTKCEAPLDTTGYPKWCKKCQNAYRKEYNRTKGEMSETRGYAAGRSAEKEFLASRFEAYRIQVFSGPEIAHIIRAAREVSV